MEEILKSLLLNSHGVFAYATVFAVLVACGLGVPLPEDISLILGGFMAHQGAARLPIMMAVGFVGILIGDSLIYLAGRRIGRNVGKSGGFFASIVTPEKRARVEGLFGRHGQKIVMIARFMPGVRAVTYLTAGSAGMRYRWFILWDGLAAMASAPIFVFLGFTFGDRLQLIIGAIKRGERWVLIAMLVALVGFFVYRRLRPSGGGGSSGTGPDAVAVLGTEGPIVASALNAVSAESTSSVPLSEK